MPGTMARIVGAREVRAVLLIRTVVREMLKTTLTETAEALKGWIGQQVLIHGGIDCSLLSTQ